MSEPGCVLVVEDDPLQRMMAVDMIEAEGLAVIEAADATQAIVILERRADIRLVFTDIDMPRGGDGLWLANQIRARWPAIALVVISGKRHPSASELPDGAVFFAKPYIEDVVGRAVRQMIG